MSDQHDHLILKFLSGTATAEERQQLDVWSSQSPENKKMLLDFKKIWEEKDSVVPDFKTTEEWLKLEAKLKQADTSVYRLPVRGLFKVAASVTLIAVCSMLVYQVMFKVDSIVMQSGHEKRSVSLPDGSMVWLNAHSAITYSSDFNEERNIQLRGEAFFEVTPDPSKPFVIITRQGKIQVLGTSFNVSAYEHDAVEEVYVATGKVSLASGENRVELKPGELGTLNRNTLIVSSSVVPNENRLAWRTGKLIFRKTNLTEVVTTLEHYFQISITIKNPVIEKCRFTSSFTNPTLEEVIEAISLSMNLNVVQQNTNYVFDGEGCGNEGL